MRRGAERRGVEARRDAEWRGRPGGEGRRGEGRVCASLWSRTARRCCWVSRFCISVSCDCCCSSSACARAAWLELGLGLGLGPESGLGLGLGLWSG